MIITRDHIGGLVFLCLSVVYGYYAGEIPLLPGDEFEPFHARTLPETLAVMGGLLSLALILTAQRSEDQRLNLSGYNVALVAKLLVLVVLFGLALKWLGFVIATIFFLMAGFWLLGERRIRTLLIVAVPFAVGIWFVLAKMLDIYLAPGALYLTLFGG